MQESLFKDHFYKIVVLVGAVETVENSVMSNAMWDLFPNLSGL